MELGKSLKTNTSPIDPTQLQQAFAIFNEASAQLSGVYQELQQQVAHLTHELALANGELQLQLAEKEDLSRKLSLLLNALPGGVVVLDTNEYIEQVNPASTNLLGESLIGERWPHITEKYLSPTPVENEWWVGTKPADEHRIRIKESPLDAMGRQILLIHDITEAHALQEQIKRNQRLTSMGEMAANLAHQLRTPLSTALLYATHLGNETLSPDERLQFATKTVERLHHLENLTHNMLRFVKGEAAQIESINITDFLNELKQVIEPQVQKYDLQLEVQDHSNGTDFMVDHKALNGAVVNLLENAIQASHSGDQITLACSVDEEATLLTVQDTGSGIEFAVQERIFEPFYTTRSEGTGLGLAIVRGIIRSMGGAVQVNSIPGTGSEFVIKLPNQSGVA